MPRVQGARDGSCGNCTRGRADARQGLAGRCPPEARAERRLQDLAQHLHARGHLRRRDWLALSLGLLVDRGLTVELQHGPWLGLRLHAVYGSAYGGLIANSGGLAHFGQAVLGHTPGMLPEVRRALLTVVPGAGPRRSVGWYHGQCGGHAWFGHAGGGLGGYGELRVYPQRGATSVLLTNGPGLANARCLDDIDRVWLEATGTPGSQPGLS